MTRGFRGLYGAGPLHLIAHLAVFCVAGFSIDQIIGSGGQALYWVVWFLGAALLHDVVLLPLYGVADRALQRLPADTAHLRPVVVNYVRVPATVSGILLLVYLPLILGKSRRNYLSDTGHHLAGYTRNWLLITAGLFLASVLVYLARTARHRLPHPRRG